MHFLSKGTQRSCLKGGNTKPHTRDFPNSISTCCACPLLAVSYVKASESGMSDIHYGKAFMWDGQSKFRDRNETLPPPLAALSLFAMVLFRIVYAWRSGDRAVQHGAGDKHGEKGSQERPADGQGILQVQRGVES